MADEVPTDPPAVPPVEDKFGVPHGQAVSDSLHLWILIPGLLGILLVGRSLHVHVKEQVDVYFELGLVMYKLLRKQGERGRKRMEKKLRKQEKEKKKAK